MKWLVISCLLLFFSVGLISAVESVQKEIDKCYKAFLDRTYIETHCDGDQLDEDEFVAELNTTLMGKSSDDPNVVRAFGEKYCPKVNNSLNCIRIGSDLLAECLDQLGLPKLNQEKGYFRVEVLSKILEYACENDSAALVLLAPDNGFEAILNFNKFASCLDLNEVPFGDSNSGTFQLNPLYCDGISISANCYLDYLRDHKNRELTRFMNEIHELVRGVLKCSA